MKTGVTLYQTTSGLYRRVQKLMGNRFELTILAQDEEKAKVSLDAAVAEIQRIEKLLTTFADTSETNKINALAGISPFTPSPEVYELIARSRRISELTQGAFDITYGGVDKSLWNFDTSLKRLPSAEVAQASVRLVNYKNVLLNPKEKSVLLKYPGMRIGFGGIGKGYAAERAKLVLQQLGIKSGIVNAAGDLTAWGNQPNGQPWTIGIADPDAAQKPFSKFNITGMAVATSGNYEKFVIINGKRYSHTINPKTGLPVTGIKSVTILCPNAELADAMATPVMVMGVKVGLALINQMKNIACILVDDQDRIFYSDNIRLTA
ncbi:FAD:protein FMN transferase [Adhaeribacter aerolatus]|uniref:FAD:protein FMN transferase n=1 Tax=Adhaeribacter aerolatus TaxID=670289 RepID=A0A512B5B2_9BACT|nr:FAD:protein FMN transferase [Adhaeribacter aerolatus]GEO07124.1 FAD:protein FMN transferase [Adhaeribacter aerolatus]